jgi:(1->4)-alpha-D-glucan 1-alpha-D-glucosylmutase
VNALVQTALLLTSPGVPDLYQGGELWDLSLVDPDNRRPVDYQNRVHVLDWIEKHGRPKELLHWWQDGRIKMFILWKSLTFRREHPEVFMEGEYLPIEVSGRRAENVIAFARHLGDKWILVAAPRLMSQLTKAGTPALGRIWADTVLQLPPQAPRQWRNVFTGKAVNTPKLADIFSELPFALLERAA